MEEKALAMRQKRSRQTRAANATHRKVRERGLWSTTSGKLSTRFVTANTLFVAVNGVGVHRHRETHTETPL